jgi:hypothetical protein
VTVTNTGTGTLVLGDEIFSSGDFLVHSNTCNGAKLPAAGKCTFKVAFAPQFPGTQVGEVIIYSNATTSPDKVALRGTTKEGTQLLQMGSFDVVTTPIPWVVSTPQENLVRIRDCVLFQTPFCSARFTGARGSPTLSAVQMVRRTGSVGDKFYIGLSSRASRVPLGGQYKLTVSFYGPAGLVDSKTFNFTSGTHAFQTVGMNYVAPAPYNRILFNFVYQKSTGVAWFDDALLILLP